MEGKIGPTAGQNAKGAKGANLFIPISLGNHYYSSVVLQNLMDDFISSSNRSIIFLCDRLRFLSYRIRGEVDIKGINSRIQIQIDQMKRTLDNLGLGSHPNAFVADWSFLEEDHRYGELLASLGEFVQADREVDDVGEIVAKNHWPQRPRSPEEQHQQHAHHGGLYHTPDTR